MYSPQLSDTFLLFWPNMVIITILGQCIKSASQQQVLSYLLVLIRHYCFTISYFQMIIYRIYYIAGVIIKDLFSISNLIFLSNLYLYLISPI